MLTINIPKESPKSIMKKMGKWSALSLDSMAPPPEVEPGHLYDATILISGKTAVNLEFKIAVGRVDSVDATVWYFVGVWIPTEFLADDFSREISLLGTRRKLDLRAFLETAPDVGL